MKVIRNVLVLIVFFSGAASAATPPIHGPGAQEISASKTAPELGGDLPQSCMVVNANNMFSRGI